MNSVSLIGRLTRDPDVRYSGDQMAVARFSIAIDRQSGRNGEKQTDYPNIVCFGKTAELVEKYMGKGRLVGIQGRIQTGSYVNKDGQKVYTTDVVADRVEFLDRGDRTNDSDAFSFGGSNVRPSEDSMTGVFNKIEDGTEDDIPF